MMRVCRKQQRILEVYCRFANGDADLGKNRRPDEIKQKGHYVIRKESGGKFVLFSALHHRLE